MIRNNLIFFYFVFLFCFTLSGIGNSYEISIANKYNEIFSNDILNADDIENYRKIYLLQKIVNGKAQINIFSKYKIKYY